MSIIRFEDVDVVFSNKPREALALLDQGLNREQILKRTGLVLGVEKANLDIQKGEICVLMGLSGSGKSSLLRCINGLNTVSRGKLFVEHGQEIYGGQIIGQNSRDNDLGVNPTKGKKLDNMRASGKDEVIALVPPVRFTLEQALEYIQEDELCEVTPKSIRLRKKILDEGERTRAAKKAKN